MPVTSVQDLELVSRARGGDVAAFTELVRRYETRIWNLAYRLVSNADDAADVAQETFLAAFEGLKRFRAESSFYTWLYRIAVNRALAHRAARAGRRDAAAGDGAALETAADGGAGPEASAAARERSAAIDTAIRRLPEDFRAVVVLKDVEGLEYEEIAEALGIALGTVKSRLHRGRMILRDALRPWL